MSKYFGLDKWVR